MFTHSFCCWEFRLLYGWTDRALTMKIWNSEENQHWIFSIRNEQKSLFELENWLAMREYIETDLRQVVWFHTTGQVSSERHTAVEHNIFENEWRTQSISICLSWLQKETFKEISNFSHWMWFYSLRVHDIRDLRRPNERFVRFYLVFLSKLKSSIFIYLFITSIALGERSRSFVWFSVG